MEKITKKIILKLGCLILLAAGVCFVATDTKAGSFCPICPEGTVCQGGACTCVCFDSEGNCTYS